MPLSLLSSFHANIPFKSFPLHTSHRSSSSLLRRQQHYSASQSQSHHLCCSSCFTASPRFLVSPQYPLLRFENSVSYRTSTWKYTRTSVSVSAAGTGALLQDVGATVAVLIGAYSLVFSFEYLTQRNLIQQSLSRKLVHIMSGLLFMVSWPIFSTSTEARYFASFVPLVNCLRLVIYGLSLATDQGLIKSVTREGNPEELLRGPLYYVLILILCALVFWRESPIGMISLGMMCGGDGIADIMGRRFGSLKIPYNQKKSWAGSISMFIFGFFVSIGILYYYSSLGYLELNWMSTFQKVALISFVATLVESLPITERLDDNISVPLASMVVAYLCFGY